MHDKIIGRMVDKMKKILIILLTALVLTGCSSKLIELKEGITKETSVELSNLPFAEELADTEEGADVCEELPGDKYIINAIKDERTETMEFLSNLNR